MPSSQNRKRVEIPSDLYERLNREAEQRNVPVSALATFLLLDALSGPSLHPTLDQRLDEILSMIRDLRAASTEQHREMRSVRDEIGAAREYMLLQFPEGTTDVLVRHSRHEQQLRGSRNRLIEQLRGEHTAPTPTERESEATAKSDPSGLTAKSEGGEK